jgi:soluble lytic murein transglycosylase-like protein
MAEDVKMYKIIQIESNGNPRAYNKSSGARGLCQITQICLNEWNNYKAGAWGLLLPVDLWNPDINLAVATWYINERIPQMLKFYDIKDTIENRLRAYNSGIGTLVKGRYPQETRDYVRKYFNQ